jgi:hypothetical protein
MKRYLNRVCLLILTLALVSVGAIGLRAQTFGLPTGQQYSVGSPVYITPMAAPVSTGTTAATLVLKASAGNLFMVTGTNPSGAAAYMIVQNSATAATTGTVVPVLCAEIPAGLTATIPLVAPAAFTVGISVSLSSVSCFSVTGVNGFIAGLVQ